MRIYLFFVVVWIFSAINKDGITHALYLLQHIAFASQRVGTQFVVVWLFINY